VHSILLGVVGVMDLIGRGGYGAWENESRRSADGILIWEGPIVEELCFVVGTGKRKAKIARCR
jgi:hypothetical protein